MTAPRDTLIHLLTEAAEIEHNLLCSYLYAAFSLKGAEGDGLSDDEARTVEDWRKTIVGVAIEEMGHLALVNNLLVAIGGAPHFDRPNLPVAPGYHPAGFVIRLMPLTRATLDHFIYLERPADAPVPDGRDYRDKRPALQRVPTPGELTPSTPDYDTIGDFYAEIRTALVTFAAECMGSAFLKESVDRQLGPNAANLPGLILIHDLGDALAALETIVEQGEGSSSEKEDCHFARFQRMRGEWSALEAANPRFVPTHPAAHDPVMRRPAEGLKRVWITAPHAARLVDLGNALYGFTLTLLQHAYAAVTPAKLRAPLVGTAIGLMHPLAGIARALAREPAAEDGPAEGGPVHAGLTFAVPRNLRDMPPGALLALSGERLAELRAGADALTLADVGLAIGKVAAALTAAAQPAPLPRASGDLT